MSPSRFKLAIFTASAILGTGFFLSRSNTSADVSSNSKTQVGCEATAWMGMHPWEQFSPSKDLVWKECAPDRQCARLIVPLNHSDPDGEEAVIALVRKPAAVPQDSELYRGPILFNPGGPGASGVDLILRPIADLLSTIVGPEFDLVSFDPRGISRSTPRISFFKTDIERSLFGYDDLPLANNTDEGIHRTLARAKVVGQLAAETDNGYLRHMNTDQTARDMLRIVEAYGRSKLQYWGLSCGTFTYVLGARYGTLLGATFASIFPDKIERMVLDGVADAEDYYAGKVDRWLTSLVDTDKVLDGFFIGCAEAGPESCEFWAPTADNIRQNLTNLFEHIRSRPMPIKADSVYGILDYTKLKKTIFTTLYKPYMYFPALSKALAELAAGNGTALYSLVPGRKTPVCSCDPSTPGPLFDIISDSTTAIQCNDGEYVSDDVQAAEDHFEGSMKVSQWGDLWARSRLGCIGWPKFPKTQFRGPFEGKTSHPILLIGNTADPVTPLWAARNMSRGFEGSVVLQQNSLGHCSFAAPSLCTQQHVRKYFLDGTLPPKGTVCEPISQPFPNSNSNWDLESQMAQAIFSEATLSAQDHKLLEAVVDLSKMDVVSGPFFRQVGISCGMNALLIDNVLVPLNHHDPEGDEAVIALVRKPAAVPEDSEFYRGPILFNPGGPGGSGVDLILGKAADQFSTIVGPGFDIVGFDPRGISRSTPHVSFFKTDIERSMWGYGGLSLVNNTDEAIYRTMARAKVVAQLAEETDSGYLRYMNTEQTARDMLRIVEAHGISKLQYWGFSYGTLLGATFASMFPDKIERMLIDGVVDAEDYYTGNGSASLVDTDKALDNFYMGCAEAGPEGCDFWAPTPDKIRQNLTKITQHIHSRPMPIKSGSTYGILDYAKLRKTIFTSLYSPFFSFPVLAKALAELAAGNGTSLYSMYPDQLVSECSCDPSTHLYDIVFDSTTAITCNDFDYVPDDAHKAGKHLEMMLKVTQWGELWSSLRFNCIGWPKLPRTRFRGPFVGKTSHPILLIGNTADPVTPLWAAKNMSRGFEGSVVLQQNSVGHCSISAPSLCTLQHVREYFQVGNLPPPGTVCEPIGKPFPDLALPSREAQAIVQASVTSQDHALYAAGLNLSQMRLVSRLW
ncbi:hypothetical protein CVT25_009203 [Psilocybe cyanescens]|uniref:Peptidase S33 tripeptidyl aminopeptidase-like C-terminal domain-containing protein n=1 Tax=Psilocybe cyanescens TaxID=93625 RepID=A0A409WWE4_PSICY|nr:hypothetical protein CVT25_009203 [Psilocybe cyanescens]